ncbi:MAG: Gfo/Idh/MocA family oxidoreductase [Planctomycetes bacterium]|nr:Gfo/Idh/MocA family oxidoreductase [Planctomycetota bacterium]
MNEKKTIGRRRFLKNGAAGAAALGLALSADSYGRVLGAGAKLGLGFIGTGGRGQTLMGYFLKRQDIEIRAVCDVYEPRLQQATALASPSAAPYPDYRRLLERPEIDAAVVATPDHWHARMVIDAVKAGKDAYVEKPLCHTIEEGFSMIEAVQKTRRVVQVGTQRRSYDLFIEGKKVFDSGKCGPVRLVNSWWYNQQTALGQGKLSGKLDWEKWLGSAPKRPLDELRFFNWYYYWDYSGGLMVGQAAHAIDAINWFMNSTYPAAVTATGCPTLLKPAEVPETTVMAIEYPDGHLVVFTLGYAAMAYYPPHDLLKQFHGLKARFDIGRESFYLYPPASDRNLKAEVQREQFGTFPQATDAHIDNFLSCCRSRKTPNAPVEVGQHTNVVLCMAMESIRTGRRLRWNAEKKQMEA